MTVDELLRTPALTPKAAGRWEPLKAPGYAGTSGVRRTAMAVGSMKSHTTNEGWELMLALAAGGYGLVGYGVDLTGTTDARDVLRIYEPDTLLLQDKREWEGLTAGPGFDQRERFANVGALREREDIFKLTVLKDAQHNPGFHRQSADEIGCHAWVVYYRPKVVARLAPYVRLEHLVRTYHTVDRDSVPPYVPEGRRGALLSGAVSAAYPLRKRLVEDLHLLPNTDYLRHPGYGRDGCKTPEYLKTLSRYRVAICTASVYGYALRKIVEATACGCRAITDLPSDEMLPEIDGNLVRVESGVSSRAVGTLVRELCISYCPSTQQKYAEAALRRYDYRAEGVRLAGAIEELRRSYPSSTKGGGT